MNFFRIYISEFLDGMVATYVEPSITDDSIYAKVFDANSFLDFENPFELILHDFRLYENAEGWKPRFGDIHKWITGSPNVPNILVSEALKELLVNFKKPEHKWYDVNINFEDEQKKYFQLCLKDKRLAELDFSKTSFALHNGFRTRAKEIKIFNQGQISSLDEYIRMNGNFHKNRQTLRIKQAYYDKNYDLFWGGGNSIIINEKLRIAIEEAGFDPFGVVPIPEGQIIMAGT